MKLSTETRLSILETLLEEREKALQLQAKEYDRRLQSLNHAHEKAEAVQRTYVTQDRYEDRQKAETLARSEGDARIGERFEAHVTRYEDRHAALTEELTTMRAENNAIRRISTDQSRKTTRNLTIAISIATIVISIVVAVANLGTF